ncbi:MAG: hypothetical protein HZC36_05500, partial [Armatimonadetes bacterium]|nr:hypothetical protein [Armatimonadota bacterium]
MKDSLIPKIAQPAIAEIERGMALKKCRKCGCMKTALDQAEAAFGLSEETQIGNLVSLIREQQVRMEPLAYDCIGCKKCWGADATIKLAESFEGVELGGCEGGPPSEKDLPVDRRSIVKEAPWPPYPGDYTLGDAEGSVAVCTLSDRELPALLASRNASGVAIAGRCDTENIGIEKVVLNMIANPGLRWLVLAGTEAKGHRAGDAFLSLKERGVDADMRVLESASWRPILKNLSLLDVARFREQVEVVNLIGKSDPSQILKA